MPPPNHSSPRPHTDAIRCFARILGPEEKSIMAVRANTIPSYMEANRLVRYGLQVCSADSALLIEMSPLLPCRSPGTLTRSGRPPSAAHRPFSSTPRPRFPRRRRLVIGGVEGAPLILQLPSSTRDLHFLTPSSEIHKGGRRLHCRRRRCDWRPLQREALRHRQALPDW